MHIMEKIELQSEINQYLSQLSDGGIAYVIPIYFESNSTYFSSFSNTKEVPIFNDDSREIKFLVLNVKIKLKPLDYAIYKLFCNHAEGIILKEIGNLKEELHEIYLQCSPRQNPDKIWETIHELLSPTNYGSSLIQSISRIKNRFKKQIPEVVYRSYTISGCRGKAYSIPFLKTMA